MAKTEQQRIANALQTMAGIEPSKANETEQQRIAAAVEALAQSGGGGGSSGMEQYIITATETYDESTEQTTYTVDKTFNEIVEAIYDGKLPVLIFWEYDASAAYTVYNLSSPDGASQLSFSRLYTPVYANDPCTARFDIFHIYHLDDDTIVERWYYDFTCTAYQD